jgi:hypothetical protein
MSHQSKTLSYIRTEGGREGGWSTWEVNREERGRICRDQVGRPGEQVAERSGEKAGLPSKHWPSSLGLPSLHWPMWPCRSSIVFRRFLEGEDERLPWLAETKPTSLFMLLGWSSIRGWQKDQTDRGRSRGRSVARILRFFLSSWRVCNVGITDGRDMWCTPLEWAQVPWFTCQVSRRLVYTKYHDDRLRNLSNIMIITTVWEAVMLVLLIEGIYEVTCWDCCIWHDIHTEFHEDW